MSRSYRVFFFTEATNRPSSASAQHRGTIFTAALAISFLLLDRSVTAEDLKYNRDVRPILSENCFKCHGPDSASRKADLRVDRREDAVAAGAIVPSTPDESELVRRIFSTDPETVMPPPDQQHQLTDQQRQTLKQWVAQGAAYEPHWSFQTPRRPEVPAVTGDMAGWPRNAIDNFVAVKLAELGLSPAPEADHYTLARRLSLDLRGVPPTPEEIDALVQNKSDNAYEQFVDALLTSPQWGEHRGRYWLDAARYADTHGIHFDNYREMWSYREWVINAFNRNLPFDQFTTEQLAGDLLPNATLDQQIASGFNRCNMTTNEGGIIDEEYLVLYARDRVETTAQVFLGMTLGCAVCHDHKFDPVSQSEFYQFAAFFNNTTQAAKDGNIKDTPPIVVVPLPSDVDRSKALSSEIPVAKLAMDARRTEARGTFDQWLTTATPELLTGHIPSEGLVLHAPLNEGEGKKIAVQTGSEPREVALLDSAEWKEGKVADRALYLSKGGVAEIADVGQFDNTQSFTCSAWIKVPANDGNGAIVARMDNDHDYRGWDLWLEGRRVGMHIIHKWSDDALKVVSKKQIVGNEWTHVTVSYDGSQKAAGIKIYINGEPQETNVQADSLKNTTLTDVPFKIGQRHTTGPVSGVGIEDLRLYERSLTAVEATALAKTSRYALTLAKEEKKRTKKEVDELFQWWLGALDERYPSLASAHAGLEKEQADIRARGTIAHIMNERPEPAMAYVLFRGDYDKRRDQVSAGTPAILPKFAESTPHNRLGLAQWLLRDDHPLTARVTVNRFWQELFGTGFVRTSGDFGISGDLPTHQDLLDWLAVEFRESGWDVKRLFKLMVMSATYRQSAITTADKLERDPQNRFLSRGPRFRMDAEMVRDYALAASGILDKTIGGPSVKPYQPDGVWEAVAMNVSNTRSYQQDTGPGLYRRSMYTFWKRAAPPASMDIFNAPSREFCTVRRERTNTPLQALVTLNDPQFVEAARRLAESAIAFSADTDARIEFVTRRLVGRPLQPAEVAVIKNSLASLSQHYNQHEDDAKLLISFGESKPPTDLKPADLAAWTMLTNELMNLDEVLNK